MTLKPSERVEALRLRRDGLLYREIMQRAGVAKSTVWRWLKAEGLVDGHSPKYLDDRMRNQRKAAEAVHRARLERTEAIMSRARGEIGPLTSRDLRLIGAALYWAEGAKQKPTNPSERVIFGNTDPHMLRVFVRFLTEWCNVSLADLSFSIHLHESADAGEARAYWCSQLGLDAIRLAPIIWKRHNPKTVRKNVGAQYHGLLCIIVRRSTDLNRRIMGWVDAICATGEWCKGNTGVFGTPNPGSSPGSPAFLDDLTLLDGDPTAARRGVGVLSDGASVTDYWVGHNGMRRTR